jgi:hypothetical protein
MSRRDEEKKRRRLKRQKKRQRFERSIDDSHDLPEPPEAFAFLRSLTASPLPWLVLGGSS